MAIYLKMDGVDGESAKAGHEKWIEVTSFSWGASSPTSLKTGGGLAAGTVNFQDANFQIAGGRASLLLLHFLNQGKHFSEITIDFTKAVGDDKEAIWWQVKSKSAFITSYNVGATGGEYEAVPSETLTIAFGDYMQEIWEQKTEGGALESAGTHGYDLKTKTAS